MRENTVLNIATTFRTVKNYFSLSFNWCFMWTFKKMRLKYRRETLWTLFTEHSPYCIGTENTVRYVLWCPIKKDKRPYCCCWCSCIATAEDTYTCNRDKLQMEYKKHVHRLQATLTPQTLQCSYCWVYWP